MGELYVYVNVTLETETSSEDSQRESVGSLGVLRQGKGAVRLDGVQHYLWRAVDLHGNALDVLVQSHRHASATKEFFRRLLEGSEYVPRAIVTDKRAGYSAAHREIPASVEHRRSKYVNNRAQNSHQPTRQRERPMKRFTSPRHAQRFLSAFSGISPHFRPGRHRLSALE